MSKVALVPVTEILFVVGIAPATLNCNVAPETVVVPVYVFT